MCHAALTTTDLIFLGVFDYGAYFKRGADEQRAETVISMRVISFDVIERYSAWFCLGQTATAR